MIISSSLQRVIFTISDLSDVSIDSAWIWFLNRWHLCRRSQNIKRGKSEVRKAHALEETRARKKQKLDRGRLKQVHIILNKFLYESRGNLWISIWSAWVLIINQNTESLHLYCLTFHPTEQIQVVKAAEEKPRATVTVPQEFRFCTDTRARVHLVDYVAPHTFDKVNLSCFEMAN